MRDSTSVRIKKENKPIYAVFGEVYLSKLFIKKSNSYHNTLNSRHYGMVMPFLFFNAWGLFQ